MKRGSMSDFACYVERLSVEAAALPAEGARIMAPVMAETVKSVFGRTPPLADLAESTQAERAAKGYAPNEPLVRTGDLRDSVESAIAIDGTHALAMTGSADPLARIHEDGSAHFPPRPTFRIGAAEVEMFGRRIWKGLIGIVVGKAG